jgi:hypothetical protein
MWQPIQNPSVLVASSTVLKPPQKTIPPIKKKAAIMPIATVLGRLNSLQ